MFDLARTLKRLKVRSRDIEIMAKAPPTRPAMLRVYRTVNEHLLSVLETTQLGQCKHLTGECAALVDPLHRRACRVMWEQYRESCEITSWIPSEHQQSPASLASWHLSNWKDRCLSWRHSLDVFFLLGTPIVRHFTTKAMPEMHYSIFGNDMVLLQAQHPHPKMTKHVWFVRSSSLNTELRRRLAEEHRHATPINQNLYREFTFSIQSRPAIGVLSILSSDGTIRVGDVLRHVPGANTTHIEHLVIMGFVQRSDDVLTLTQEGSEFLAL